MSLSPVRLSALGALTMTATLGSLAMSEVLGFTPCPLCWYQRALMYPLALLCLSASLWRWTLPRAAALTLVLPGVLLAFVQSLQFWGLWSWSAVCTSGCSTVWPLWTRLFGAPAAVDQMLGIPVLSLIAFSGAAALCLPARLPREAGRQ